MQQKIEPSQDTESYINWLAKLNLAIESSQKQIIKLILALKLDEVSFPLQLYSAEDKNEILFIKGKIAEINEHRSIMDSLNQQIVFFIKALPKTEAICIANLILQRVQQQNLLLIIAHQFCNMLLYRQEKKFPLALIKVNDLIENIETFLKSETGYYAELAKNMLTNAYTQKAKIHRSLAGIDLETLNLSQLQLSQKSYELALGLQNDHKIMTSLGFLFNDHADQLPASEREKKLQQALEYHEKAKLLDPQNPHINHGIALDLYKLLKLQKENNQVLDTKKIQMALAAFLCTERQNPNARLHHDRGLLYQLIGEEQHALLEFKRGLVLDPNHLLLLYARGLLYFKMGEYLPALHDFHLGYLLSDTDSSFKEKFALAIDNTKKHKLLTDANQSTPELENKAYSTMIPKNADIRQVAVEAEYKNALSSLSTYANPKKPIKVFISYAWGVLEHEQQVERIVNELSHAGFNVLYDKREDRKGKHLMEFVDKMISEADFIIVIGSKLYLTKYNYRTTNPNEYEHVVAIEGAIASYWVMSNRINSEKIIPVMIEGPASKAFPPALLPKLTVNLWERDWHLEMFSLISSLYRISYGDEKYMHIMRQFSEAVIHIKAETTENLAKKYHAPIHQKVSQLTFFQQLEDKQRVSYIQQCSLLPAKL